MLARAATKRAPVISVASTSANWLSEKVKSRMAVFVAISHVHQMFGFWESDSTLAGRGGGVFRWLGLGRYIQYCTFPNITLTEYFSNQP